MHEQQVVIFDNCSNTSKPKCVKRIIVKISVKPRLDIDSRLREEKKIIKKKILKGLLPDSLLKSRRRMNESGRGLIRT